MNGLAGPGPTTPKQRCGLGGYPQANQRNRSSAEGGGVHEIDRHLDRLEPHAEHVGPHADGRGHPGHEGRMSFERAGHFQITQKWAADGGRRDCA